MNNYYDRQRRPAPQGAPRRNSYDYNDIYGRGARDSGYSGMMQTDSYKSMRSGSLDSLEDDFEEEIPARGPGRRASSAAEATGQPTARPEPKVMQREEFLSDEFDNEFGGTVTAEDQFQDDFADFGYGFDSFEPEVQTRQQSTARNLDEYRAMRQQQDYTVREEMPVRAARPAPQPAYNDFDDDFGPIDETDDEYYGL